jgi:hypothetical protein
MVVETLKLVLSATCIVPLLFCLFGASSTTDGTRTGWVARRHREGSFGGRCKIQRCCSGMLANADSGTPKFFASTSGGVCANQSVSSSVLLSEAAPSSKHATNSQPSGPRPSSECANLCR